MDSGRDAAGVVVAVVGLANRVLVLLVGDEDDDDCDEKDDDQDDGVAREKLAPHWALESLPEMTCSGRKAWKQPSWVSKHGGDDGQEKV